MKTQHALLAFLIACGLSAGIIAAETKSTNAPPAQVAAKAAPAAEEEGVQSLFDGKTLKGWKETDFVGKGKVEIKDCAIILHRGNDLTGVQWVATNSLPVTEYELELDAMRVDGSDFFCGLTFPVGKSACTMICGGWGGTVVGISSINDMDASENETSKMLSFEKKRWYHIRIRVTDEKIETWIDKEQMADVDRADKKISMRFGELEDQRPFGIASWQTTGAIKNIKLRRL